MENLLNLIILLEINDMSNVSGQLKQLINIVDFSLFPIQRRLTYLERIKMTLISFSTN